MQQLIMVMIATGIAGGLAGYFISLDRGTAKQEPSDDSRVKAVASWFKYVFLGVIAALIVPLFLSLAKSDLVTNLLNDGTTSADPKASPSDIFVFAGFCLVAAISSRGFIQSISDRILREAREARKTAEAAQAQAEKIADTIVEPEPEDEPVSQVQALAAGGGAPAVPVSEGGKAILQGLRDRGYTLRSTGGLARDTGLQNKEVIDELDKLSSDGLVRMVSIKKKGKDRIRWTITPAGRDCIAGPQVANAASGQPPIS
jgi:hypothetical protein